MTELLATVIVLIKRGVEHKKEADNSRSYLKTKETTIMLHELFSNLSFEQQEIVSGGTWSYTPDRDDNTKLQDDISTSYFDADNYFDLYADVKSNEDGGTVYQNIQAAKYLNKSTANKFVNLYV
ncbi:hypothetical protein I8752_07755 [Nostocaceae cyanobacterium CENA369]|uniref:Uncharacterized protein n=1 Tax=Dendronalium phyllosphericum CENA369 TaxID=1725256 RepID=A0A8J7I792_9NOST|nr:hypothetical protein [Dendronalium phyllosphericum]MBH8572912.1 hypothetical protein [Dendronalium phyllosphericum CENA369]